MQLSDIPVKFSVVWGSSAAPGTIRTVPVAPGGVSGAASFQTGFPTINFVQVAAGGVPPFGQDINGILEVMSAWGQWAQAGGAQPFDPTFAAEIGGYPKCAVLPAASVAGLWFNTTDNNSHNPDAGDTTGWVLIGPTSTLGGMLHGPINAAVINNGVITDAMMVANTLTGASIEQAPAAGFFGATGPGNGQWLSVATAKGLLGSLSLSQSILGDTEQWTANFGIFIIAFGRTTRNITTEAAHSITLPTPFPTACLGTLGNAYNTSASGFEDLWVQTTPNQTASTLEFFCQATSPTPGHIDGIEWVAFGH